MTVIIMIWVLWNCRSGPPRPQFDSYPFIFLTLILSLQASYAAPLILLAQNRQEARDRVALDQDREQAAQSRADMDFLAREIASVRMSVGELATRDYLRSELRSRAARDSRRARGRRRLRAPAPSVETGTAGSPRLGRAAIVPEQTTRASAAAPDPGRAARGERSRDPPADHRPRHGRRGRRRRRRAGSGTRAADRLRLPDAGHAAPARSPPRSR